MSREPFDLQKIRRNWERAAATVPVRSPDRLAGVPAPLDPYAAGAQLLERLRHEVHDAFPAQQRALAPFLDRADACFTRLREEPAGSDASERRAQLMAALRDLEDICEAFLGLGR